MAVARACGLSHAAVSQWDKVPPLRVRIVAKLSGLAPHEIRPDIFDPPEGEQ